MGGNAIKALGIQATRLSTAAVVELYNHLARNWTAKHSGRFYLVPWVNEKMTHGDIDIVVEASTEVVRDFMRALYPLAGCVTNDKVVSFAVPGHVGVAQVDMICEPDLTLYRTTQNYYAGADIGMMIGRVAAAYGLKYGMAGLLLRANADKPWSEDIQLLTSPVAILQTLGYRGETIPMFNSYEDVWAYIMSSDMAKPWMFAPEATNHENRSRDKNRPSVERFQAWVSANYGDVSPGRKLTFDEAVEKWHPSFSHIKDDIWAQERCWTRRGQCVAAFGRNLVAAAFPEGLPDEEVGPCIRALQPYLPEHKCRRELVDEDGMIIDDEYRQFLINTLRKLRAT